MAKKKKGGDARGYATSSVSSSRPKHFKRAASKPVGGKAKRQVQVSQSAQDEIASLMDELKESLRHGDIDAGGKQPHFSLEDKKMIKKITNLNDQLVSLGFTTEQITSAFVAILSGEASTYFRGADGNESDNTAANPMSIDRILDWMCMHLPTKDLPKLFTDTETGPLDPGDEKLSKITFEGILDSCDGESSEKYASINNSLLVPEQIGANKNGLINNFAVDRIRDSESAEVEDIARALKEEEEAAKRQWLLQQYQYEDHEQDEEGVLQLPEKPVHEIKNPTEVVDEVPLEKNIEEVRLEKLEMQNKEDRASLNDDVANYMRSKYEIADLKKKLRKTEQQAKGLRAKIAKMKAKEKEEAGIEEDQHDEKDDCNGGIFSLFDNDVAPESNQPETTVIQSVYIPELSANISPDWTGKRPKELFLEQCRKKKTPKPSFSKIPATKNGCAIKIKLEGGVEKVVQHEGPFSSFKDAEHFASTKALYELDPNVPLYRLLPPLFRDLWKGWLDEKEADKGALDAKKENERQEQIQTLIRAVQDALPDQKKIAVMPNYCSKETEERKDLEDWDDESWDSNSDKKEEQITYTEHVNVVNELTLLGKRMQKDFKKKELSSRYQKMKQIRVSLPMYSHREQLLEAIKKHPVTVLCAETGAGKTTQCPQFILEQAFEGGYADQVNIICTQPRRISALSVAERVAEEMDERIGKHIGYQIRMEAKRSKETRLMFCTTGVVLRRLQDDPDLKGITHVIVDECHERQWQIDFLLIALRHLLATTRKDLKVVLMSATLDSELFCSFFNGAPFFSIPGRTFPVNQYYLEDILEASGYVVEEDSRYALRGTRGDNTASVWVTGRGGEKKRTVVSLESELESLEVSELYDGYSMSTRRSMEIVDEEVINYELIEDLLTLLMLETDNNTMILAPNGNEDGPVENGSVLVFLPGIGEIRVLNEILKSNIHFGDERRFDIIPMHSTLSPKDQKRAFMTPMPGCRKIVLATNICETSVTIADCVCVIDTGLERQIVQNKRSSTSTLVKNWCSRASAKQRAGRAGRVQPGICCKLYSSRTANTVMKKQATPELQRVPLEEVCLSILAGRLSDNCMNFLLQAPQPPSVESVDNALRVLEEVGAIAPIVSDNSKARSETITPLGLHLAKLPVHVRLGKMLIFGALFGVLDMVLTVVSSLSAKSPFVANIDNSPQVKAAHKAMCHPTSDFLTSCKVWDAYIAAMDISPSNARKFCTKNFLNRTAFIEIGEMRKQFFQLLSSIGFIDRSIKTLDDMASSSCNKYNSKEEIVNAAICAGLYPNIAHVTKEPGDSSLALYSKSEKLSFHKSSTNFNKSLSTEWILFQEKFATSKTFVSTTSVIQPFCLLLFGHSVVKHLERKVVIDGWIQLDMAAQVAVMFRELKYALAKGIEERMESNVGAKIEVIIDGICRLLTIEAKDKL